MKYDAVKERLDKADAKVKRMKEQIQAAKEEMNQVKRGKLHEEQSYIAPIYLPVSPTLPLV